MIGDSSHTRGYVLSSSHHNLTSRNDSENYQVKIKAPRFDGSTSMSQEQSSPTCNEELPPTFAELTDEREKFVCNQMPIVYPKYKYQKHLPSFEDINQRSTEDKYKLQTDLIEKKLAELKARELELEAKSGRALKQQANNEPELAENSPILIISNSVEGHHEQNRGHD